MTFEELGKNTEAAVLPKSHPFFEFEEKVLSKLQGIHPQEHDDIMRHWSLPIPKDYGPELTVLDGTRNRVWHLLLHFKYWNEVGINQDLVSEMQSKFPKINLGEIPLPRVTGGK